MRAQAGEAFLAIDPRNDKLLAWHEQLDFGFRKLDPAKRRIILKLQVSDDCRHGRGWCNRLLTD